MKIPDPGADPDFYDREYDNRRRVPAYGEYFARWRDRSLQVRRNTYAALDLRYGMLPAEKLDFFPAGGPGRPLLIFLHGGYWRSLDKGDFSWIAAPYLDAGISVAVVNYGLAPATPLLQIVEQVRRACAWLHHNARRLEVDAGNILCCGHSAGGHLAAMMLATDWPGVWPDFPVRLLQAAVVVSGLFDLRPLLQCQFLGNDLRLDPVLARALSPALLPCRNEARLLRAVGAGESAEFQRQSALMSESWPAACDTPVLELPHADHFAACEALADVRSSLFQAGCGLLLQGTNIRAGSFMVS